VRNVRRPLPKETVLSRALLTFINILLPPVSVRTE
jgi:hypothetical protein